MATWDPIDQDILEGLPSGSPSRIAMETAMKKPMIQIRGITSQGTPILDGNDPRVRKVAQMLADSLEAMVRLDQTSICATDVLSILMRDGLWCRDNYYGANNPKITASESEARIAEAKRQILDPKRFNDFSDRYISHVDSISKSRR